MLQCSLKGVIKVDGTKQTGGGQPSKQFLNVSFEYDETTRMLKAVLTQVNEDPQITFQSLNAMITQKEYAPFKIAAPKVQQILREIEKGKPSVIELGIKPEFTSLDFTYDDNSRILSAILEKTEEDPGLSLMKVQEAIRDKGYDAYEINNVQLQTVVKNIKENKRGTFPIGKKPQYTDLKLVFNPETNELHANLSLAETNPEWTVEKITEVIKTMGYDDFLFKEGIIVKLAENIQKNSRGNILLAEKTDASIAIDVAKDDMQATLVVKPAHGGKPLERAGLVAAIEDSGILLEMCDPSVLDNALEKQALEKTVFVEGIPAVDGEDATFEPLVNAIARKGPRIDEKDYAHLRDIQEFTVVDVGCDLMRRHPATPGTEGKTIKGQPIAPTPGQDFPFDDELNGAAVSPDDINLLVATQKGSPIVCQRSVKIDNVMKFNHIDLHTGNVKLDGSILIEGNVRSGMVVEVSGGVIIKGAVHNATIIAGEDIVISEGIIGSQVSDVTCDKNTARLTAGGNIEANFVNFAVMQAGKDIKIGQYITHSDVIAAGKVIIGEGDGKGQLIGGRTNAVNGLFAKVIGAKSSVLTKITVGFPLEQKERYKQLKESQVVAMDKVVQTTNHIEKYKLRQEKNPSDSNLSALHQHEETLKELSENLGIINKEIAKIEKDIEKYQQSKIVVTEKIYDTTSFNINGAKRKYNEPCTVGGAFFCEDKQVKRKD